MDEMNETKTPGLMNKTQDELTVGDIVKINAGALVAVAAVYGAVIGGVVGYNKFAEWRFNRRFMQEQNIIDVDHEEVK